MKKTAKLKNTVMGVCVDCGLPHLLNDEYIVRGEVWRAAGMTAWDSGYLHRACLEKRLGRPLTDADLLVWRDAENDTRTSVAMQAHPDYLTK